MLAGGLKVLLLLNTEPAMDATAPVEMEGNGMVVTFSPFKANMDVSDVLLPIAPFSETSGTFVNAEGRVQSFHAVVKPLGDTRPAWKVLRVLGDMLGLAQPVFNSSQEVLAHALGGSGISMLPASSLSNATQASITVEKAVNVPRDWGIYELDGIVRRAPALQQTTDAREYRSQGEQGVAA